MSSNNDALLTTAALLGQALAAGRLIHSSYLDLEAMVGQAAALHVVHDVTNWRYSYDEIAAAGDEHPIRGLR